MQAFCWLDASRLSWQSRGLRGTTAYIWLGKARPAVSGVPRSCRWNPGCGCLAVVGKVAAVALEQKGQKIGKHSGAERPQVGVQKDAGFQNKHLVQWHKTGRRVLFILVTDCLVEQKVNSQTPQNSGSLWLYHQSGILFVVV